MTDREKLYNGVSAAAWSYLFLYFNVNLGRVPSSRATGCC